MQLSHLHANTGAEVRLLAVLLALGVLEDVGQLPLAERALGEVLVQPNVACAVGRSHHGLDFGGRKALLVLSTGEREQRAVAALLADVGAALTRWLVLHFCQECRPGFRSFVDFLWRALQVLTGHSEITRGDVRLDLRLLVADGLARHREKVVRKLCWAAAREDLHPGAGRADLGVAVEALHPRFTPLRELADVGETAAVEVHPAQPVAVKHHAATLASTLGKRPPVLRVAHIRRLAGGADERHLAVVLIVPADPARNGHVVAKHASNEVARHFKPTNHPGFVRNERAS